MDSNLSTSGATAPEFKAGDYVSIYLNQANRDGEVLAVLGQRVLFKYSMEKSGRVFGGLLDYARPAQYDDLPAHYTSQTLGTLPIKWQQAIAAQGGVLTVADLVAAQRGTVEQKDFAYWAEYVRRNSPWVFALPCHVSA